MMMETDAIHIEVEPQFLSDQSKPEHRRWFWAYTVRIENRGSHAVTLRHRYWTITNGEGRVEHVDGPGVVGEEPLIEPGGQFLYTSGCPLDTPSGTMEGHYMMERADGSVFRVEIPAFSLDLPDASRTLN
jgi:ApaG protein